MYNHHIHFFTATILAWKHLLKEKMYKQEIMDSLNFLVENKRVRVFGFVFKMGICEKMYKGIFYDLQAQQMLKELRNKNQELMQNFYVGAKDRKYQIWERNSLSIELWNEDVFLQKLAYIHQNPVRSNLCVLPEDSELH